MFQCKSLSIFQQISRLSFAVDFPPSFILGCTSEIHENYNHYVSSVEVSGGVGLSSNENYVIFVEIRYELQRRVVHVLDNRWVGKFFYSFARMNNSSK